MTLNIVDVINEHQKKFEMYYNITSDIENPNYFYLSISDCKLTEIEYVIYEAYRDKLIQLWFKYDGKYN